MSVPAQLLLLTTEYLAFEDASLVAHESVVDLLKSRRLVQLAESSSASEAVNALQRSVLLVKVE